VRRAGPCVDLSVVVATTHPWPEVRGTLDSLWAQAHELGVEILIVDGHGQGVPEDLAIRYPGAMCLKKPGASVFALRTLGMQQARGEIVALTEDHCRVGPDWCRQLLETHQRYPHAAAVGGAVENGSTEALIDWANYFVAHSPMMPPIRGGAVEMISAQAGVAFKRRVLPRHAPPHGIMEMLFLPELRRRGETLIANERIVVHHIQSHGFWSTFAVHFHNGRSIGGFRRSMITAWQRPLRLAWCAVLPAALLLRALVAVVTRGRFRRQLALSLPLVVLLACCHSVGEFIGYWGGAGRSPEKLS
jgi:hypothetical protein